MEKKKIDVHYDLFPVDLKTLLKGNIYQNVNLCSSRAEQIEEARQLQIKEKLNEWLDYNQDLNDASASNNVLEKISKYFSGLQKSTNIAVEEFLAGKLTDDMFDPKQTDGNKNN